MFTWPRWTERLKPNNYCLKNYRKRYLSMKYPVTAEQNGIIELNIISLKRKRISWYPYKNEELKMPKKKNISKSSFFKIVELYSYLE